MKLSRIIVLIFGFCLIQEGMAQTNDQHSYHLYNFDLIRSEGLFKSIIKDDQGNIWIASDEGITLFDGRQTKIFNSNFDTEYIKDFLIRRNGDFLVLHDNGLAQITFVGDSIVITNYLNESLNYPKTIYEDASGKLFIGENDKITEIKKGKVVRHNLPNENEIPSLWRSFVFDEDENGNLWATSFNGKVYSYNRYTEQFEELSLPSELRGINSMICTGNSLLIGSTDGFYQLIVNKERKLQQFGQMPHNFKDISVMQENGDYLLIGTWNNGLYEMSLLDPEYPIHSISNVPHPDIIDIYLDEAGIWLAGNENIDYLERVPFGVIPIRGQKKLIQSIEFTLANEIVLLEEFEIFLLKQESDFNFTIAYHLITDEIYAKRAIYKNDTLWIGDFDGNIHIHDIKNGITSSVDKLERGGLGIEDMLEDSDGNIWACGNPNPGIIKYKGPKVTYFKGHPNMAYCVVMTENDKGEVITAGNTEGIVFTYNEDHNSFDSLLLNDASGKRIKDIWIHDLAFFKNRVYLATSKGVFYYEGNKTIGNAEIKQLELDSYTDVESKSIAIDAKGTFWVSNNFGLVRLNNEGDLSFFDRSQGLPSKILKERGLTIDLNQKLWIATDKGLSIIKNPDKLESKGSRPQLSIARINGSKSNIDRLGKETYEVSELKDGDNLELVFTSNLFPKQNLEYQYTFTSVDTAYTILKKDRVFPLFTMKNGDYTLEVKVRKEAGFSWSNSSKVRLEVRPYFYQTWWVISIGIAIFIISIFYASRWYKKRVKIQAKRLEGIVKERTQELNKQKNELIEQQQKIINQKDELLEKNESLFETKNALTQAELKFRESKEKHLEDELEYRNKQLTSHTLNILQKSELMEELATKIDKLIKKADGNPYNELKKIKKYIDNSLHLEKDWDDFKLYFEQVHTSFYSKLAISHPNLTPNELRHCALIRLNLSLTECASILGISTESVKIARFRLRKKLELPNNQSLTEFVMGI